MEHLRNIMEDVSSTIEKKQTQYIYIYIYIYIYSIYSVYGTLYSLYRIAMKYRGPSMDISLEYHGILWNIVEYIWHTWGMCIGYVWKMYGIGTECIRDVDRTCMALA